MDKSPRDKSLGAQMAIALKLLKKKNHQTIINSGSNITMEQLGVLEILITNGNMNMTELSKTVWKQNANITRIIDKLEKQKLVVRKAVEGDRRVNLISITPEGKHLYNKTLPLVVDVYQDAVSCISKKEETIVLNALKKIIVHLA